MSFPPLSPFTMRRSDGGSIVERRNNNYNEYWAYSAIPGFYEDFTFPSSHPVSYATCGGGQCYSNGLKKCVKCGSTSSKAKVRAQLDAAKKKATPKGETPAQTKKRSEDTAKKQVEKSKACGSGKAWSSKENKCVDRESTRVAVHPSVQQAKDAAKQLGIGTPAATPAANTKFGTMDVETLRKAPLATYKQTVAERARARDLRAVQQLQTAAMQDIVTAAAEFDRAVASAGGQVAGRTAIDAANKLDDAKKKWKSSFYGAAAAQNQNGLLNATRSIPAALQDPELHETALNITKTGATEATKQVLSKVAGESAAAGVPVAPVVGPVVSTVSQLATGFMTGHFPSLQDIFTNFATETKNIANALGPKGVQGVALGPIITLPATIGELASKNQLPVEA